MRQQKTMNGTVLVFAKYMFALCNTSDSSLGFQDWKAVQECLLLQSLRFPLESCDGYVQPGDFKVHVGSGLYDRVIKLLTYIRQLPNLS